MKSIDKAIKVAKSVKTNDSILGGNTMQYKYDPVMAMNIPVEEKVRTNDERKGYKGYYIVTKYYIDSPKFRGKEFNFLESAKNAINEELKKG